LTTLKKERDSCEILFACLVPKSWRQDQGTTRMSKCSLVKAPKDL